MQSSVGCGHKVVLGQDMSYGSTYVMDDMLYGVYVLCEVILCMKTCLMGEYVFWLVHFTGKCVYWKM